MCYITRLRKKAAFGTKIANLEIVVDYLGGPRIITRVLTRGKADRKRLRVRVIQPEKDLTFYC